MENQEQKPKKKFYKRWWFWVLVAIVVFTAIGSSGNKPQKIGTTEQPAQQKQVVEEKTQTFKLGDKVQLGDYVLVVNTVEPCSSSNQFMQPKSGNKFVVVDITQENQGADPRSYNVWDYKLQDSQDFTYQTAMTSCREPGFSAGTLQKGQKTRGFITFEIPKENTAAKLIFTPSWLSTEQIIINLE